jgi:hypothetical protein
MKTRLEADEVAAQLERCDKENKILKDEMNKEIEAVLRPFLAFFPSQFQCLICGFVPTVCSCPCLIWTSRVTDFPMVGWSTLSCPLTPLPSLPSWFFVVVLRFEIGASSLLGRCSIYHLSHAPSPFLL